MWRIQKRHQIERITAVAVSSRCSLPHSHTYQPEQDEKNKLQKHNTIVVCETNRQCNALLGDNGAICLVLSSHTHCTQHVRIEMLLLKWHRIYRSERLVRQFRNFYLLLFTDTQSAHTCTSTQVHIRKNWLTVNCSRLLTHSHWHTLNAHTHSALISYQ